jgi:hypothetical protein
MFYLWTTVNCNCLITLHSTAMPWWLNLCFMQGSNSHTSYTVLLFYSSSHSTSLAMWFHLRIKKHPVSASIIDTIPWPQDFHEPPQETEYYMSPIKVRSEVKLSHNRLWRRIGLWNVKEPALSIQLAHRWLRSRQSFTLAMLYSPETVVFLSLTLIYVRGWLHPRDYCNWKD